VIAPRGYYLLHPIDILQFWEGGLASHGGAFYEKLLARGKKPIVRRSR
jgi:prolipoprotein diacylglyceryltransferase